MRVVTKSNLIKIFKKLGIKEGDDILLHTSMRNFGYFVNGPYDILNSIYDIINLKKGTLLIPTHTGQMSNPKYWKDKVNYKIIKDNINEYDSNLTLPRNRGLVSLLPLIDKRFKRSSHPLNSISAIGKKSRFYTSKHPFEYPEGYNSPIWRLYKKKAFTLLFGVDLKSCSSIHLAEYIMDLEYLKNNKMSVYHKGSFRKIQKYPENSNNFNRLLPHLKKEGFVKELKINKCKIYYINIYQLINCCIKILKKNKNYFI